MSERDLSPRWTKASVIATIAISVVTVLGFFGVRFANEQRASRSVTSQAPAAQGDETQTGVPSTSPSGSTGSSESQELEVQRPADNGSSGITPVGGEPGIGKTDPFEEFQCNFEISIRVGELAEDVVGADNFDLVLTSEGQVHRYSKVRRSLASELRLRKGDKLAIFEAGSRPFGVAGSNLLMRYGESRDEVFALGATGETPYSIVFDSYPELVLRTDGGQIGPVRAELGLKHTVGLADAQASRRTLIFAASFEGRKNKEKPSVIDIKASATATATTTGNDELGYIRPGVSFNDSRSSEGAIDLWVDTDMPRDTQFSKGSGSREGFRLLTKSSTDWISFSSSL